MPEKKGCWMVVDKVDPKLEQVLLGLIGRYYTPVLVETAEGVVWRIDPGHVQRYRLGSRLIVQAWVYQNGQPVQILLESK